MTSHVVTIFFSSFLLIFVQCQAQVNHCPVSCFCSLAKVEQTKIGLEIRCPTKEAEDLEMFFQKHTNITSVHVDQINFNLLPKSKIGRDFLGSHRFKAIRFVNSEISFIHENAFTVTENFTEEIHIVNCSLLNGLSDGRKIFDYIRKFKNLRVLQISGTNLRAIMDDAFTNSSLNKLAILRFPRNRIEKFGDRSCYDLANLTWLDLSGNQLSRINAETFAFRFSSEKPLQLDLDHNILHSNSFQEGSFTKLNRPIILYIRSNQIEYLPEKIFLSLLKSGSFRMFSSNNKFVCDCNNRWILEEKQLTQDSLDDMNCEDGQSIWSKDSQEFHFCDLTASDLKDSLIDLVDFMVKLRLLSRAHENHIMSLVKA